MSGEKTIKSIFKQWLSVMLCHHEYKPTSKWKYSYTDEKCSDMGGFEVDIEFTRYHERKIKCSKCGKTDIEYKVVGRS